MTRLEFTKEMRTKYPENYYWNHTDTEEPPYSWIAPGVPLSKWVEIGKRVIIHSGVRLGSQGFGFEPDENGELLHIPHIGKLIIEDDVEIFENCNLCRGTIFSTIIGKGTKIDALCHVGHNAVIGKNCLITACSIIGGSAILGDDCYVGLNATIKDHVTIAQDVYIGMGANVVNSILEAHSVYAGNPAKFLKWRYELTKGGEEE